MIPENRRNKIIELLNVEKTLSLPALARHFDVSEITIRRDLEILEKKGLIDKTYGGASKRNVQVSEIHYLKQLTKMQKEKRHIANECVKRISNGSTILLHGGTTCLEIAKNLNSKRDLKIITCFPPIIDFLWKEIINKKLSFELYCPGGKLQIVSNLYTGNYTQSFFKNIIINISFIGVIALNINDGFMVTTEEEARVLNDIFNVSEKTIAPMDHSKFSKSAFIKAGNLDKIDEIITDKGLSDNIVQEFRSKNIIITRV
jgi:DeoR family transcriptional regulator, fructose operon transcriptional repressor